MNDNGTGNPGPPFAFIGQGFTVLPYRGVIEALEKNAVLQAPANLTIGPLFRKVADDFRAWGKYAEPGWSFQAPEVHLVIIRLSAHAPVAMSMSEEARARAEAEAAEPPPTDRGDGGLIFRP